MQKHQVSMFPQASSFPQLCPKRTTPKIWIKRLMIWQEPGAPIRDIAFKKGLNIIWTPDDGDKDGDDADDGVHIGHGAGKTMLCRLIRYCMGEGSFTGSELHGRIKASFPHGFVGAELEVGGMLWAVIRPIGESRAEYVAKHMVLEQLWDVGPSNAGITPLIDAIDAAVFTHLTTRTIPSRNLRIDWAHTLPWLTRDQECRFHGILAWRGTSLESKSPVSRHYSHETKTHIARALLHMMTEDEATDQRNHVRFIAKRQELEARRKHLLFVAKRLITELSSTHNLGMESIPVGPLLVRQVQEVARKRMEDAQAEASLRELDAQRLTMAREQQDRAEQMIKLSAAHATSATIAEQLRQARILSRQHLERFDVLRQNIQGILGSEHVDLEHACTTHHNALLVHVDETTEVMRTHLKQAQMHLKALESVRAAYAKGRTQDIELVREFERERVVLRDAHYQAHRLLDETERLDQLAQEIQDCAQTLEHVCAQIKESQALLHTRRAQHKTYLEHFSTLFDAIVQRLVGEEAHGEIRMDGRGIDVALLLGGRRVSAALESLKVVAFDLAALLTGLAGESSLPGFLLHDSPREADLGLSLYDRLFALVDELAQASPEPAFQYIITTTTAPPQRYRAHDVVLMMRGTPTCDRLLRADL